MESPKDIRRRVASIRALSPVDATAVEAVPDKKTAKKLFGDFGCVRNASDGYKVRFSKESVGKILRHRGFDQSSILAVLDKVFEGSLWAWDDPVRYEEGKKRHRNFLRYRNYVGKVLSSERVLFVRFTITETMGDGNLVHSTFVSDVRLYEDKSAGGLSTPDNNRAKVASALLTDDRLANWFASVNGGGMGVWLRVLKLFVIVATGLFMCPAFLCLVFCVVDVVESRHLDLRGLAVAGAAWLPVIVLLCVWHWIDSKRDVKNERD